MRLTKLSYFVLAAAVSACGGGSSDTPAAIDVPVTEPSLPTVPELPTDPPLGEGVLLAVDEGETVGYRPGLAKSSGQPTYTFNRSIGSVANNYHVLEVTLRWPSSEDLLSLEVIRPDGRSSGVVAVAGRNFQLVQLAAPTAGNYQLIVREEDTRAGISFSVSTQLTHPKTATNTAAPCLPGDYCVGSGKARITPDAAHIAGVPEDRLAGLEQTRVTQRFHLGGFGFGPFEPAKTAAALFGTDPRICDPSGIDGSCISNDAARRAYHCPNAAADCAAGEQEHTWVRAFYVSLPDGDGPGEQVLFITIDAIGAGNLIQQGMAAAIAEVTGVPETNILIGQTHSHAGADLQGLWGGVPQDWVNRILYGAAADAARQAVDGARFATMKYASGVDGAWNNYRRPRVRPSAVADERMGVLQARNSVGAVIGTFVQYSAHPTAVGTDAGGAAGRAVHADYAIGLEDAIEDATGATAIYFNGAIADASGSGPTIGADDYERVRSRGECIAATALSLLTPTRAPCSASELTADSRRSVHLNPALGFRQQQATLPITNPLFIAVGLAGAFNRYYDFAELPTSEIPFLGAERDNLPQLTPVAHTAVSRVSLGAGYGRVEIVTMPGEATNTFGQQIRDMADTEHMMLLGLTQNSFGYILPEEEFSFINADGDDGFVLPFTGYEEFVSLGPLTAPMLRLQAYAPLFDIDADDPRANPSEAACLTDPTDPRCAITQVLAEMDRIQKAYAGQCRGAFGEQAEPFCALLDPDTDLRPICDQLGFDDDACRVFGEAGAGEPLPIPQPGSNLAVDAADAAARGCDMLDPSNCLLPFPSDHFTVVAPAGSPQAAGSGRRVNLHPLATPRNTFGKPIDPTEWNRNDGFSPGQMIVTYVPGLAANADGTVPGAPPITDIGRSLNVATSSVVVINAETGIPHPVWAEIDLNAGLLLPAEGTANPNPTQPRRPALLIRPARNFDEGARYIVVLKNLRDAEGELIPAQPAFAACRDGESTDLPPLAARCEALAEVLETVDDAVTDVEGNQALYLAWDFTVASAENNIARLRHMRDDAFINHLGQVEDADGNIVELGRAPDFTVDKVTLNPGRGIAKRIEGTITIPSYVTPVDPALGDDASVTLENLCAAIPQADMRSGCEDFFDAVGIADGGSLPPNRLRYLPDAPNPLDPAGSAFGDGLPDAAGTMTTRFMCQVPPQADPENPARPGIYGHGLLDGYQAITYDKVPEFSVGHNMLFCAVDLFGFATGDVPNVLSVLVDLSNFPVIPDGSQQGLLNFLFLARALRHPDGFASHPEFQAEDGRPVFDNREVFYDGNSQGGITGGPIVALSKDVRRGVLGVVGMNYSTLLRRSVDFDNTIEPGGLPPYALPLYLSYTDDLDRDIGFALMQMLWDRSENNGYAHHITDNTALNGPDNELLLHPAFADHQVTHWSAQVMARTIGVEVADIYQRYEGENVPFGFDDKFDFLVQRDPDTAFYWDLPLVGRNAGISFDAPGCQGSDCRSSKSAYIAFDEGRTLSPPIGNVPPRGDDHDPHGYPRGTAHGMCQKSHFLHPQGRIIDTRPDIRNPGATTCPPVAPVGPAEVSGEAPRTPLTVVVTQALADAANGDLQGAIDRIQGVANRMGGDQLRDVTRQIGELSGTRLPAPQQAPDPVLPAPQPLMAGVARGELRVPVGAPLGGYLRPPVAGEYIPGAEAFGNGDPSVFFDELVDFIPSVGDDGTPLAPIPDEIRNIHSPYATWSPASRGVYDSLVTKSVALYDGNDYLVFVKTDFIGMIDEVVMDVADEVLARTGKDVREGLVMSATHTHDGPGALANHAIRYFWLAMDVYQHDLYRQLIDGLAEVVAASLENLEPAVIGHGSGTETLGLNGYRRSFLPHYDRAANDFVRKRIGVVRVDSATSGEPLAVMINWAAHGIAFDVENLFFSGDVLGAVEREVEQGFDGPVTAMLIQSAGGNISPRANIHSNKLQRIESYGKRLAPQVRAIYESIQSFQTAPDLRAVSQRVVLDRDRLGYDDEEFPYEWGAAQCWNDIAIPFVGGGVRDIPGWEANGGPTKIPYCIPGTPPDVEDLIDNGVGENGAFLPQDTRLTAARIGDLLILAQPGEPTTEYGVRVLDVAEQEQFAKDNTFIWGYAQDHAGYILPPEEDDWKLGGTEGTTTFWGWKQGARFLDVNRALIRALRDGTAPPADEFTVSYFYEQRYDQLPAPQPVPSLLPGSITEQPTAIERFGATRFTFEGGDPVIDRPQVTLEFNDPQLGFVPARRANGEAIADFFEMHLGYRLVSARHLWTVDFEAPKDWPLGEYRFRARGTAVGASNAYEVLSAPFTVSATESLLLGTPQRNGDSVSITLSYPSHPNNYRVVDARVHEDANAPVRGGQVIFFNGSDTVIAEDPDRDGVYVATIAGEVQAGGRDAHGNTTTPIDFDGDGVADAVDSCPGTAPGAPVDENGCAADQRDSDGDGIDDAADQCPDTSTGEPVDAQGCSQAQQDDDGDGVDNATDACPNTPAEEPANSEGCSEGQLLNASCTDGLNLEGNRSYQVLLPTHDGETVSFQVMEPASFDCGNVAAGAHPLMLHGPGYSFGRSTSGFADLRGNGYTVISWDPRGFGDSSGSVRVMDPEFEAQYFLQILDWAEANLDYLSWRDEGTGDFVARPASMSSEAGGVNLVVGAQGSSYGGGYQLMILANDHKKRLDAIAPDITWHDLRNALNPGDVIKTLWDLALTGVGESQGHASMGSPENDGQDPFVKETLVRASATNDWPSQSLDWFHYRGLGYWCAANGYAAMPYPAYGPDAVPMVDATGSYNVPPRDADGSLSLGNHLVPANGSPTHLQGLQVFLTQSLPDTLFNFNEAWWNAQCLSGAGATVSLYTHLGGLVNDNTGHAIPYVQSPDGVETPVSDGGCPIDRTAFFNAHLKPGSAPVSLDETCFALAENDSISLPSAAVLAPQPNLLADPNSAPGFTARSASSEVPVPNGVFAALHASGNAPVSVALGTVDTAGVLAGMARLEVSIASPAGLNEMAQDCSSPDAPTATGCDSITFVGLGIRRAGAQLPSFKLIDDQLTPVRGLGTHSVDLVGVAERLEPGDELALLYYGQHPQFASSYSRDGSIPAVAISGDVALPIYVVDGQGQPVVGGDPSVVLSDPGSTDGAAEGGVIGALGRFMANLHEVTTDLLNGDPAGAGGSFGDAVAQLIAELSNPDVDSLEDIVGLDVPADEYVLRTASAARDAEPVILKGRQLPDWTAPEARGIANPHVENGALGGERNAHNGRMIYPAPGTDPVAGADTAKLAAFRWDGQQFVEIPVQVDEVMPYFLANPASDFAFYSGTDEEYSYAWDEESWKKIGGICEAEYPPGEGPTPDPVPGIDNDDEIVFMASDAGDLYPDVSFPADWESVQLVALADPLDPAAQRYVYLVLRDGGSSFGAGNGYVNYQRNADADQWIDRSFFDADNPEKLGSSNTGYGPNLSGTVCPDGTPATARSSSDRFARDGVVVSTDTYRWEATGRWMVRDIRVRQPGVDNPDRAYWVSRPDLVDRWKGRAFQQSPDSTVSLVGFEDEQVNWEANAGLLGERCGPVRCMREVWGADSGTNVTKVETFYRDAVTYRYRVRVHPIPPDGLYTSWDYNRDAMVSDDPSVPAGRYFTVTRPQGVPIDGINDDIGNVDGFSGFPAFFDAADPTFNLPLGFMNWEQVSGKGDLGSLVYLFEMTGATSLTNPLVVPYYRDDACLDDGTGDDPVARPWPGEESTDSRVITGYEDENGGQAYETLACEQRQGAHGSHGVHYFFTHDSDNAFSPVTSTEIDGTQWQFMVPTDAPTNVGETYANVIKAKLVPTVMPLPVIGGSESPAEDPYEGLKDGSFEGAPEDGGYQNGDESDAFSSRLVTSPEALIGARSGSQSIDLGVPGRTADRGFARLLSRVHAFTKDGVALAEVERFSYAWRKPSSVGRGSPSFLHHYLFIDLDDDGTADGCLFAQPATEIPAGQQLDWAVVSHGAEARYSNGVCSSDPRFDALPMGPQAAITKEQVLALPGFDNAQLEYVMLRLWGQGGDTQAWPEGSPVYVDDLSIRLSGAPEDGGDEDPAAQLQALADEIIGSITNPGGLANTLANTAAGLAAQAGDMTLGPAPARADIGVQSDCSEQSWIAGTTEICNGVLIYRDYVYDDFGADTQARYESPYGTLGPAKGDARYPAGQENTADFVNLSVWVVDNSLAIEAELNTLYEDSGTRVFVAIDSDNDASTGGGDWPGLGIRSDGFEALVELDIYDHETNTAFTGIPLPPGSHWRLQAVATQADGTVMNVAFRGTEENAHGLTRNDLVGGTYWEDRQADVLATGDISEFGYTVAVADLTGGVTRPDTIRSGLHQRVYVSDHTLGAGEGISVDGIPGRDGANGNPCEQVFNFLGKYQPYGLYIPSGYDAAAPVAETGVQLVMHGCEANHASLINGPGMQRQFGEELNRLLVVPLGRGPTGFYSDISERDVLDVLADLETSYAINTDRVFAGGYSMGGYGALRMAALYPDRFAGVVNWVGFTGDIFNAPLIGSQVAQQTEPNNSSTGAYGNVLDYVGNLRHIPSVNLYAGADELVTAPTAAAMMEAFRNAEGVPYDFHFHPVAEHLSFALLDDWQKEADYSAPLERAQQVAQVRYRTESRLAFPEYGLSHDRAYWVHDITGGASGYIDVDLTSFACGDSLPAHVTGYDGGVGPAALPYATERREVSGSTAIVQANRIEGSLGNVSELTIDVPGACLSGDAIDYRISTDGPATIRFSDGRDALVFETAGTFENSAPPPPPPEPPADGPIPTCEPVSGEPYCLDDIPGVGGELQDGVEQLNDAINGGGSTPPDGSGFLVGTGEGDHNPVNKVCLGSGSGCSRNSDPSTDPDAIRDPLIAKATAITGANGETLVIVTTTNIGYFLAYKLENGGPNGIYDVRLRIAEATGVPSTNVVVVSDHSHNGPDTIGIWGGVTEDYMRITADAVVAAAVQAVDSRRPAVLSVAAVNQNGNPVPGVTLVESSAGYDKPANDPENGTPDNEFRLLVAKDADTGDRILTMMNYAPHATVINGEANHQVSGDWAAWGPQEAEAMFGGLGLAAIGSVGGTDWNKSGSGGDAKEAEARARLRTLLTFAEAALQPVAGDAVRVESTFIREAMAQPVLLANYKPGAPRNSGTDLDQLTDNDIRIDRSTLPPFLTGTVVGTYVSAVRIGDVFLSTFPGEPFGDLEHALKGAGGVIGPRAHFLLGGANDFFGYMVFKPETYAQLFQTGFAWLAGCPDKDLYEAAGQDAPAGCADHWTLMVSPSIGPHIVCSLQDAAERIGFTAGDRGSECAVLTALDNQAPPLESGHPLAGATAQRESLALEESRALADRCVALGADLATCDALREGVAVH